MQMNKLQENPVIDPRLARHLSMAQHPSQTAPKPKLIDRTRAYRQIVPAEKRSTHWPRITLRATPGMASGELVWSASIWEALGKPVRNPAGLMVSASGHDRADVLEKAERLLKERGWSKLSRLRVQEAPVSQGSEQTEEEPPC